MLRRSSTWAPCIKRSKACPEMPRRRRCGIKALKRPRRVPKCQGGADVASKGSRPRACRGAVKPGPNAPPMLRRIPSLKGGRPRECRCAVQAWCHVPSRPTRAPKFQGGAGVVSKGSQPRNCSGAVKPGRHVRGRRWRALEYCESSFVVSKGSSARL